MRSISLLMALTLAGCVEQKDPRFTQAEEAVKLLLTDPASAQFRNVGARPSPGKARAICGQVNAKSQMGGYVGFQDFYFDLSNGAAAIAQEYAAAGEAMSLGLHDTAIDLMEVRTDLIEKCANI